MELSVLIVEDLKKHFSMNTWIVVSKILSAFSFYVTSAHDQTAGSIKETLVENIDRPVSNFLFLYKANWDTYSIH